jgi:hypothetical protein
VSEAVSSSDQFYGAAVVAGPRSPGCPRAASRHTLTGYTARTGCTLRPPAGTKYTRSRPAVCRRRRFMAALGDMSGSIPPDIPQVAGQLAAAVPVRLRQLTRRAGDVRLPGSPAGRKQAGSAALVQHTPRPERVTALPVAPLYGGGEPAESRSSEASHQISFGITQKPCPERMVVDSQPPVPLRLDRVTACTLPGGDPLQLGEIGHGVRA